MQKKIGFFSKAVIPIYLQIISIMVAAQDYWSKNYGGNKADAGVAIAQAADGNYFAAIRTSTTAFWILKIDQSGSII